MEEAYCNIHEMSRFWQKLTKVSLLKKLGFDVNTKSNDTPSVNPDLLGVVNFVKYVVS